MKKTLFVGMTLPFLVAILAVAFVIYRDYYRTEHKITAVIVATVRHSATVHETSPKGEDYLAVHFSDPYFKDLPKWGREGIYWICTWFPPCRSFTWVISRTFAIDEAVLNEISLENPNPALQMVILGAGYDTRALRFRAQIEKNKIKVFELDFPPTQKEKIHKLNKAHLLDDPKISEYLSFVPIDFSKDKVTSKLKEYGPSRIFENWFLFFLILNCKKVKKEIKKKRTNFHTWLRPYKKDGIHFRRGIGVFRASKGRRNFKNSPRFFRG